MESYMQPFLMNEVLFEILSAVLIFSQIITERILIYRRKNYRTQKVTTISSF